MARQNFYMGQSVAPEHLNKLQDYADQGQANLIASLLGYGVVNGFEVNIIEGHIVGVTAGLAFNLVGERLVLAEGQQVNLAQYTPNVGEKTIKLGIVQDFIKTEPVTDSMGNVEHTKWTPTVEFVTGETLEAGVFELAEIKINPVSVVEIKATGANFTTLQKQIQNTSALNTTTEQASLQSQLLSLLASTSTSIESPLINLLAQNYTSIESPLINLITQNLQINGTEYMEMGVNDNGHYVKFESGLLVCWNSEFTNKQITFPCSFINDKYIPIALGWSFGSSGYRMYTTSQGSGNVASHVEDFFMLTIQNTGFALSFSIGTNITGSPYSYFYAVLGYWK